MHDPQQPGSLAPAGAAGEYLADAEKSSARRLLSPEDVRARFLARFAGRLTQEGELLIGSDSHRDQARNTDDCLDKLRAMLSGVLHAPKPRRKTARTETICFLFSE